MSRILVHRTLAGKPLGVWNESLDVAYIPNSESHQRRAFNELSERIETVPWREFVEAKTDAMPQVIYWTSLFSAASLDEILASEVRRHASEENTATSL